MQFLLSVLVSGEFENFEISEKYFLLNINALLWYYI